MAKLLAADASWEAADMCLQTHGGFGFARGVRHRAQVPRDAALSGRADLDQPDPRRTSPSTCSACRGRIRCCPLEGLLVVSLEQAVAAPSCSCRLADAGARVIKIERPEGDFARGYDTLARGESAYFVWLNRGKESVVLDLTKADDKALLERCSPRPTCSSRTSSPARSPSSASRSTGCGATIRS